jgi:hypothetical protein
VSNAVMMVMPYKKLLFSDTEEEIFLRASMVSHAPLKP